MTATGFETCFREQYPKLVALGVAMTGDREVARELAQETMIRAHARWGELAGYDAPNAWLRRVMTNLLIDHHRSRTAERAATGRLAARPVPGEPADLLDWATLIAPLPPSQRAVVTLYYGEDRPVDEIADVLGVAVGTVKSALAKARARLQATLGEEHR